MGSPKRASRAPKNLDAGPMAPEIDSFELHLNAEKKSPKTVRTYCEAAAWMAATHILPAAAKAPKTKGRPKPATGLGVGKDDWADVTSMDIQRWIVWLLENYSDSYANNQFRALQQFFRWYSAEEEVPNPMVGMKPPKIDETEVPVFTPDELAALIVACRGRTFQQRRDTAIIMFFRDTGVRLSELAGLTKDDLNLKEREALITGKGGKQRTVRFSYDAARALDRYLRERARHRLSRCPDVWLGIRNRMPMTPNGVYQMVVRRGAEAGVEVNPHKFRHDFSHRWLDNGGAEGDLKELTGWKSDQMLRRYGRSAAGARARRSYDRIMGN
ncbi:tyrosine-type recombinase/integrase [Nocardiopsis sp. NPDC049922]|uniref:tyrosine-type recombinase/integrase n=1 Tax=Nocardiopsis sp. NPDC049922 TaxID=3155157 RepID=UPI003406B69D